MGPIVFVVVVFGGLGSLAGCFIASIIMGMVQTFSVVIDWSFADLLRPLGITPSATTTCWARSSPCRSRASARCCRIADDADPAVPPAWPAGHTRDMSDAAVRAASRRPLPCGPALAVARRAG